MIQLQIFCSIFAKTCESFWQYTKNATINRLTFLSHMHMIVDNECSNVSVLCYYFKNHV